MALEVVIRSLQLIVWQQLITRYVPPLWSSVYFKTFLLPKFMREAARKKLL